ncbi:unnamed protein product [Leuciscus chuanchicus]
MFVRYWFIYLFLHLLDKVSLQDSVEISGVVGGFVILPCSYTERKLKTEEINVFWRYEKKTIVYDIKNGIALTEKQDAMFKGRIVSFPLEYADGNFSLRLSDLRLTDAGQFSCAIPDVEKEHKLTLLVRAMPTTAPTTVSTTMSTPKPTVNTRSSSMRAQPEGTVAFLLLFWSFVFCTISE